MGRLGITIKATGWRSECCGFKPGTFSQPTTFKNRKKCEKKGRKIIKTLNSTRQYFKSETFQDSGECMTY